MKSTNHDDTCTRVQVPLDACYLKFSDDSVARTEQIGTTSRDEMVIFDFDAAGRVVGIELVSDDKPCQQR